MVLIDYIVAENVCLGDDDKALVSFGQFVLWEILLQTIFLSGQKIFDYNVRCMSTETSWLFLTTQVFAVILDSLKIRED
jgi:hypothetical protein